MSSFDAVILAGGSSSRMGGHDKSAESVGDKTLLGAALGASVDATRIILVGPQRVARENLIQVVEDPPGGGPVSGIEAALPYVTSQVLAVLACDMPLVDANYVGYLVAELGEGDAICGVDGEGRTQYLPCGLKRSVLSARLQELETRGAPLRSLFAGLDVKLVPDRGVSIDCDTPDELEAARRAVRLKIP